MDEEKRDELKEPEAAEGKAEQPEEKQEELTGGGCLAMVLGVIIGPLGLWRATMMFSDEPNWVRHLIETVVLFLALCMCVAAIPDVKSDKEKRWEQNKKDLENGVLPSSRLTPEELKSDYDLTPEGIASRRAAMAQVPPKQPSAKKLNKRNRTICPRCGSSDTFVMGSTSKASFTRAVVGHAIAGTPGAIVGSMTGKKQRHEFICRSCGKRWRVK